MARRSRGIRRDFYPVFLQEHDMENYKKSSRSFRIIKNLISECKNVVERAAERQRPLVKALKIEKIS